MRTVRTAILIVVYCAVYCAGAAGQTHYVIDLADVGSHRLSVEMKTTCASPPCEFQMPVWSATYQVRDFAQHVYDFSAETRDGQPISSRKLNPSRWSLGTEDGEPVRVTYRVLANRPGPFGAFAGREYAALNLAQVLIYPVENRQKPFTLRFTHKPRRWKVAMELPQRGGRFEAPSYDRLIDTPVHLADFRETTFHHWGRRIRLAAHGDPDAYDLDALKTMAESIVAEATAIMEEAPFPSYTFVYRFSDDPGGGMEYRNGAGIFVPKPCLGCDVSALTAHELFHLWNVKRIRPQSLEPVDFTRPNYSPSLWFSEGVTSAYAQYLRLQSGLLDPDSFLKHVSRLIGDLERRPATRAQSAEESSIDAWLERYPGYGDPNRSVSYYLKGELIGYLLDLTIRYRTANERSLDDMMRFLNREYAQQGRHFDDTEGLEEAASRTAGADLSTEFDLLVRSARPIPWERYLAFAGLRLSSDPRPSVDVGLSLSNPPGLGIVVASVEAGGPAEKAGFEVGDRLLRVNGRPASGAVETLLDAFEEAAGRAVRVRVHRDGSHRVLKVRPKRKGEDVYQIVELPGASEQQRAVRDGWLRRGPVAEPMSSSATSAE